MPILTIAVEADDHHHLSHFVVEHLKAQGIELELYGALDPAADSAWPLVAEAVGLRVASGQCSQGIVMCWTGTGVSIAANKVPGVRAALCGDAETALGARAYNDANVLCLSLRATSEAVAKEILDAWFAAEIDERKGRIFSA
ncbi:MAG: ribose 5-phosphate isomerase B [Chloroflexi bacterium]|jgi:ribose 5-phosphate isomerase B|nr:MAG: ribose 5-phosphate isomerase B [Chloroflexota bacterium]